MKILIVDDEPLARSRMRRLLQDIGDVELVGEARSGKEALLQSSALNPDIVLLDIRMPEMDGLETAVHLSHLKHPPAVIFTTAFSQHALAAFEIHAMDYLLKPIRRERLEEAIGKARKITRAQLLELSKQEQVGHARTHVSTYVGNNLRLVPLGRICYFQAEQKYVTVRHCDGQIIIDDSLKSLEEEFGTHLLRIHRNSLIALEHVESMTRDSNGKYQICFHHIDDRLEVSRRLVATTRRRLKKQDKG
jgi:two-component system response regulator AlgR